MKYIDFRAPIHVKNIIFNETRDLFKHVISYIISWPLIAACSVKKLYKDAPFTHEYIIPQLLLKWAKQKRYDGIKYFSMNNNFNASSDLMYNYVIPATQYKNGNTFCKKLTDCFSVSNPIPFNILLHSGMPLMEKDSRYDIEFIQGTKWDYSKTIFANVEKVKSSLQFSNIKCK